MRPRNPTSLRSVIAAIAFLATASHSSAAEPAAAPGPVPQGQAQSPSLIDKGRYLVTLGDCVACHTAPGGKPFAGGAALDTPFGKIYPPNITPDAKSGIGSWSDDAFYRALHEGLDDKGHYLYPAFPFPWYTKITRDDVMAIKAYLFSQPAVDQPDKPLAFYFPFDIREGLLAWRTAFFKAGDFQPDPSKSAQWNRGAYLVEGLGHCGECHDRTNLAGNSDWSGKLQGGKIEGWYAPALTENRQLGIGDWSEKDLVAFMKTGAAPGKGVVLGPMAKTVHDSLSKVKDDDLQAIAVYLKSVPATKDDRPVKAEDFQASLSSGGQSYLSHCAFCHMPDGSGRSGAIPALAGDGAVTARGAQDVIHAVCSGGCRPRMGWRRCPPLVSRCPTGRSPTRSTIFANPGAIVRRRRLMRTWFPKFAPRRTRCWRCPRREIAGALRIRRWPRPSSSRESKAPCPTPRAQSSSGSTPSSER